jgi:hypothetical protein
MYTNSLNLSAQKVNLNLKAEGTGVELVISKGNSDTAVGTGLEPACPCGRQFSKLVPYHSEHPTDLSERMHFILPTAGDLPTLQCETGAIRTHDLFLRREAL